MYKIVEFSLALNISISLKYENVKNNYKTKSRLVNFVYLSNGLHFTSHHEMSCQTFNRGLHGQKYLVFSREHGIFSRIFLGHIPINATLFFEYRSLLFLWAWISGYLLDLMTDIFLREQIENY